MIDWKNDKSTNVKSQFQVSLLFIVILYRENKVVTNLNLNGGNLTLPIGGEYIIIQLIKLSMLINIFFYKILLIYFQPLAPLSHKIQP